MATRRGFAKLLAVFGLVVALAALAWLNRDWLVAKAYLWILESDRRVRALHIERVIEALELEPGQRIADIGAGTGVFTRPFARAVAPHGTVYAVDINAELLAHIDETAREQGLDPVVRTILAAEDDPRLPETVELAFFCDALHHIDEPAAYLKTLRRYLGPAARIAVIDFNEGDSPHFDPDMKLPADRLDRIAGAAGFEFERSHDFINDNYFRIYRCAACPE